MSNELTAREVLTPLAETAGVKVEEFYQLLKKEGKEGVYSVMPFQIEFKDGEIVHNASKVNEIASMANDWSDLVIKKGSLEDTEKAIDVINTVGKWIMLTRKNITSSLDSVKKELMKPEKALTEAKDKLKKGLDILNELEYQKTENALKDYLLKVQEELKENEDIELDLISMFDDFLARKRKTQVLTGKGDIKKSVKDEVTAKLSEVVNKIKEERAVKAEQDRQMQSFTVDIGKIDCQEAPQDALKQLATLENELDIKYPAIKDVALMQIGANRQIAQGVIDRLEKEAKEKELADVEAKAIKDVEELKKTADKTGNIEELESILSNIRSIRETVKLKNTVDTINAIGIELSNRIATLKSKLVQEQTKKEEPKEPAKEEVKTNKWKIDRESVDALLATVVEADTEEEAQKLWLEEIIGQAKYMFECGMLKINKVEE